MNVILSVLSLDEETLSGVGYESTPKVFEGLDTQARGVRVLAMPEVFFLACLNRDLAVVGGVTYGSYSSDDCRRARRRVEVTGTIGFDFLLQGVVGGVTSLNVTG